MSLAADTSPWVIILPAAITAIAAIGGGYLAGWHQLRGQREDRQAARTLARNERREMDLRELQEQVAAATTAYSKAHGLKAQGIPVPVEVSMDQLIAGNRIYAVVARVGDDDLASVVNDWMTFLMDYAINVSLPGEPVGERNRLVHDRVGELLRQMPTDG